MSGHNISTAICCRIRSFNTAASRQEKLAPYSTYSSTKHQSEFYGDRNISFNMVASMDACTLPLVLLQSNHVWLVVGDVSEHHLDGNCSVDRISKMNSISFEQLMVNLAQLQRMLVSVVAVFNSCLD